MGRADDAGGDGFAAGLLRPPLQVQIQAGPAGGHPVDQPQIFAARQILGRGGFGAGAEQHYRQIRRGKAGADGLGGIVQQPQGAHYRRGQHRLPLGFVEQAYVAAHHRGVQYFAGRGHPPDAFL